MNRGGATRAAVVVGVWLATCGFTPVDPGEEFFRAFRDHHGLETVRLGDSIPLPAESLAVWIPTDRDYRELERVRLPDSEAVSLLDALAREAKRDTTLPCRYCAGCPDHERVGVAVDDGADRLALLLDLTIGEAIASRSGRLLGRFSIARQESLVWRLTYERWRPDSLVVSAAPDLVHLDPRQLSMTFPSVRAEATTKVAPNYPGAAREAEIDGVVRTLAEVDEQGDVGRVVVTKSVPLLDAAAVDAVRRWRFKPALDCEGQPIRSWVPIPVKFSLH